MGGSGAGAGGERISLGRRMARRHLQQLRIKPLGNIARGLVPAFPFGRSEWEAAARGPVGNEYPWDGAWQDGICNSYESSLLVTSPVGLFPRSRSADLNGRQRRGGRWGTNIPGTAHGKTAFATATNQASW